jgi:hypothetical protein
MSIRIALRRARVFRWIWAAGLIAPLALVGCQNNRSAQTNPNGPVEKVAGERSDNEVAQVLQSAGLPETFAFGSRMWKGHQVHHVTRDKIATIPTETDAPGTDRSTTGTSSGDAARNTFDYMPVSDLMVQGHQIYRKTGLDEALTDNIFLMASNATGTEAGSDVAFVEYDATEELMKNMDLPAILKAANLKATLSHGGRTWSAEKMQVYDPDVFDKVKRLPTEVGGYAAYQGTEKDEIFIMASAPANLSQDTVASTSPGSDTASEGMGAAPGTPVTAPLFILYEAGGSPPGPKDAK